MAQYIDKSALVAEVRKYKNNAEAYLKYHHNCNDKLVHSFEQEKLVMCELLSFLDTLEVKEVDLEKEVNDYGYHYDYVSLADRKELVDFAKHFFELGLQAQKGKEKKQI